MLSWSKSLAKTLWPISSQNIWIVLSMDDMFKLWGSVRKGAAPPPWLRLAATSWHAASHVSMTLKMHALTNLPKTFFLSDFANFEMCNFFHDRCPHHR